MAVISAWDEIARSSVRWFVGQRPVQRQELVVLVLAHPRILVTHPAPTATFLNPTDFQLKAAIDGIGPLTATLRAAHIRFVLDDANHPQAQVAARLPGSVMIINLPGLTVYQLPG